MRVLCGELHPTSVDVLSRPTRSSPPADANVIHLSWGQLIVPHPFSGFEVYINPEDIHYALYEECIAYLKAKFQPRSDISRLLANHPYRHNLSRFPPPFGTLTNVLVDRMPSPDPRKLQAINRIQVHATFDRRCFLDLILAGVLAVSVPRRTYVTRALQARLGDESNGGDVSDADIYRAMFLDLVAWLWVSESDSRASGADWSPMPWSRASIRELSQAKSLPGWPAYETHTALEGYLVPLGSPQIRKHELVHGAPVNIPWFGAPHDGHPFCPTLSSYVRLRRSGSMQTLLDDAAVWISAMSFGLLEAVTRTRIPESLLIINQRASSRVPAAVSGSQILRFLARWHGIMHDQAKEADRDAHLTHGREVARLLQTALHALDEEVWTATSMLVRAGLTMDDAATIVASVTLTVIPVCTIAHCIWDTLPEMKELLQETDRSPRLYHKTITTFCRQQMIRAGWCPNIVSRPFVNLGWSIPLFSHLMRLRPHIRRHPGEHKACTEDACTFYTINAGAYIQRHVDPSCNCAYTIPPLDKVQRLLSEGTVPAVVYNGTSLRIQPAADNTYVAISHVWADGLGSITEVGLPTCQVARIAGLAQQLLPESSGAFWIDSLCVPSDKDMRKRAISLMGVTYRNAAKVLVIDECIRAQCSTTGSWEDNLFYIGTSGWVRRVWTLQEGLLARELYFEFRDGAVDVEEKLGLKPVAGSSEWLDPFGDRKTWLSRPACSHVLLLNLRAQFHAAGERIGTVPLNTVTRLLHLRSTTKAADEIIAVSALLPLDVDALQEITGDDVEISRRRMEACLLQLKEVPRHLPMERSPRLDVLNFRWAPRSLAEIVISQAPFKDTSGTAICTDAGLLAKYVVGAFEVPVCLPWDCRVDHPAGDSVTHYITIAHSATESMYLLEAHMNTALSRSILFDALLLLDDDFSPADRHPVPCLAVRLGAARQPPSVDSSEPIRATYVAACILNTHRALFPDHIMSSDRFRPEFPSFRLGALREMRVLLT
ncbi:hypothetical protein C8Q80DRAFT_346099 [Daedaleopsis nitida]|nr:hypothetical protein C8Q80DRAFT_346099 [Daedaleopsis nitida]